MQGQTFVFFGIAGSGKGTQVKLLMDYLFEKSGKETVYAYPGNEYRNLVESGNYTGHLIKDAMAAGHILPGFLTDAIVTNILITSLTSEKNLIADGYPREVEQSISFEKMIKFYERKNVKIIYLELSKEEATKRMKLRGRPDDTNDDSIKKRFDEYMNKVVPAMNYFKGKEDYKIYTINGEQTIENVHKDILAALRL